MRILSVGPKIPYPPTDGGRIGIFEPLRHLAARGHQISYLGFGEQGLAEEFAKAAGVGCVRAVPHDTHTHLLSAAFSLFSPLPYTALKYRAAKMARALETMLGRHSFDLVQLEGTHMAHYLRLVHAAGLPVALRMHNVESLLAERYARTAHGPLRWFVGLQARRMRSFETRACAQADLCLTVTAEDGDRIRALAPDARVTVMPAGVDLARNRPSEMPEDGRTVVFIGALDWPPNVDGARWFFREVWPNIHKAMPEARWVVVGKSPPPDLAAWPREEPSVTVTGFVEDVRPYLERASVVVVPLRSGGGMRLKIPEAFAMRKAVVSTAVGAEGLGATSGKHLILADGPADFATQVVRLLTSSELRHDLAFAAHSWVRANLGWDAIVQRAEGDYASLLRPQAGRTS